MSELRLYVDEDASEHAVVRGLRARGFDLLTVQEVGRLSLDDEAQLNFASEMGRAIYTFNVRDFAILHREYQEQGRDHAGIVAIPRQRYSVGEKIRRLAALMANEQAEDLRNQLEYL
ncbi:MAG: DUF5615 family PIN-like protein [Planctomycetota bacterium]|nr:DUF5615 family PIN-like protein [Planctomycetota bacterium]